MKYEQLNKENTGITDIHGDFSLTRKGFIVHSSFDFGHHNLGSFCKVVNRFVAKPEATVVELGCGSTVLATCLPEEATYVGLDANPGAGMYVKELKQDNKQVIILDLTKDFSIWPPLQADYVLSFDFFEHIEYAHIDILQRQIEPLLAVGGKAFFIIDTIDLPEHLIRESEEWWTSKFAQNCPSWKKVEDPELQKFYLQNVPPHWKPNVPHQWVLFFEREGRNV